VIHIAAVARTSECEKNKDKCRKVNVDATVNLNNAFESSKFVFFSTYAVYDGIHGDHVESDYINLHDPVNTYIATKITADTILNIPGKNVVILRPSAMFGYDMDHKSNYFTQLLNKIQNGEIMKSPRGQFFNPIHVHYVCELMGRIIDRDLRGVYNVGCPDVVSKYGFNKEVMQKLGASLSLLVGTEGDTDGVPRPDYQTIFSDKIQRDTDYIIPSLDHMIDRLVGDYKKWR
jgi:dTDP-4-dehydrorhamnose reductase